MSKITKGNLVILAVLLTLCNLESRAADKQEADAQQKIENPYKGARVLVEALLVEVKLDALEKAGVGLLSKEQASAAKILDIIKDKNAGRILTSEKLALVSPGRGHMQTSGRKNIPIKKDPNSAVTNWGQYDTGSTINANLEIDPNGRIFISFKIDIKALGDDSRSEDQSPEVLSYSWDSTVSMKSGTPVIASGLEGKGKMAYLILRADIEQDSLPQSFQHKK
ncbi:MAG: hypothetical protein ABR913_06425 [Sedimentisphaerales bacterium]|jgi:hypothetical protein